MSESAQQKSPESRGASIVPILAFLALLGIAFVFGLRATAGVTWPDTDPIGLTTDLLRDMSSAQTMLDSGYGPDPNFVGERSWYNPLAPAIMAATAALTDAPLHLVAVRIGTYADLLAPLMFFWMCSVLYDRWTGLFASVGYLFLLPGSFSSHMSATYSPWFIPVNFVQACFYLSVIGLYWAYVDGRVRAFVLPGLLWGLTFVGHTAPALILGGMIVGWVLGRFWFERRNKRFESSWLPGLLLRIGVMVAGALAVSAPLVAIVLGHYGLHVKNLAPGSFSEPLLSKQLPILIWRHVTIPMFIAAVGLVVMFKRPSHPLSRRLLLLWIATTCAFLLYSFFRIGLKLIGPVLPSIVPSFHFFFYFKAATAVLFGIGISEVGRQIADWWSSRSERILWLPAGVTQARAAAFVLCLVLLGMQARTYASRPDFTRARLAALSVTGSDQARVFEWLMANRKPNDVAVAPDLEASTLFGASGVKAVMVVAGFANPYVDLAPREQARDLMYAALDRDDSETFRELAKRYGVTLVFTNEPRTAAYDRHTPADLELAFAAGTLRVYRVRQADQ